MLYESHCIAHFAALLTCMDCTAVPHALPRRCLDRVRLQGVADNGVCNDTGDDSVRPALCHHHLCKLQSKPCRGYQRLVCLKSRKQENKPLPAENLRDDTDGWLTSSFLRRKGRTKQSNPPVTPELDAATCCPMFVLTCALLLVTSPHSKASTPKGPI